MSWNSIVVYFGIALFMFAIGFFAFAAFSMVKQFLATGSMMRGPQSGEAGGEREDPLGMRSYSQDGGEAGRHD
jgi:hypothetical protein